MIAIAFVTALALSIQGGKRYNISAEFFNNIAFWGLIVGIAGTRVLHIAMFPHNYSWSDPIGWIAIWRGGLVFQGAVPPVLLFIYLYCRKHGVSFRNFCDVLIPIVPLGHAIGRLGCFLNGCCYGRVSESALAVRFPRIPEDLSVSPQGSPAYLDHLRQSLIDVGDLWSLPVHPSQLYSFGALLALSALVWLVARRRPFPGVALPAYFVGYGILRFILEFFRGDHNPAHFGAALSDQQVFSLLFVLTGVVIGYFMWRRHKREHNPAT